MGIEPTYAAWEARLNPAHSITYLQNFVISMPIGSSGYEWSAKLFTHPPTNARFVSYENVPPDYYLWLTGEAGKMLRGEIQFSSRIPDRDITKK